MDADPGAASPATSWVTISSASAAAAGSDGPSAMPRSNHSAARRGSASGATAWTGGDWSEWPEELRQREVPGVDSRYTRS